MVRRSISSFSSTRLKGVILTQETSSATPHGNRACTFASRRELIWKTKLSRPNSNTTESLCFTFYAWRRSSKVDNCFSQVGSITWKTRIWTTTSLFAALPLLFHRLKGTSRIGNARLHLISAVFLDKTLTKCAEKNIKYKACNYFLGVFYFIYQGWV